MVTHITVLNLNSAGDKRLLDHICVDVRREILPHYPTFIEAYLALDAFQEEVARKYFLKNSADFMEGMLGALYEPKPVPPPELEKKLLNGAHRIFDSHEAPRKLNWDAKEKRQGTLLQAAYQKAEVPITQKIQAVMKRHGVHQGEIPMNENHGLYHGNITGNDASVGILNGLKIQALKSAGRPITEHNPPISWGMRVDMNAVELRPPESGRPNRRRDGDRGR